MSSSISRTTISTLTAVAFVSFATVSPAHAYLDPGTGSMLVQLLLGGVAGAVVVVRLYWQKLKDLIGFRKPPVSKD